MSPDVYTSRKSHVNTKMPPRKSLDFSILPLLQEFSNKLDNDVQACKPPVKFEIEFFYRSALSDALIEIMTVGNRSYSHLVTFMGLLKTCQMKLLTKKDLPIRLSG